MYEKIIESYVNKLTINDIYTFANYKNISITNNEANIIYNYIKKYWMIFYKENPTKLFNELKTQLSSNTYDNLIQLYIEYKNKI